MRIGSPGFKDVEVLSFETREDELKIFWLTFAMEIRSG